METLTLAVELLLVSALGFLARRTNMVDGQFQKALSNIQVNIVVPCVVLKSMTSMQLEREDFLHCGLILLASFAMLALLMLLGQAGYLLLGKGYMGRILRFGVVFTNFTLFGFPVVEAAFGTEGLFYFVIFTLPMRFFYYSLPQVLLCPEKEKNVQRVHPPLWKLLCTPPILSSILGLLLCFAQIPLPGLLFNVVGDVSDCCFANGMMLVGMVVGDYDLKRLLSVRYLAMPVARNIVAPALAMAIVYALPLDTLIKQMIVTYCAMPCGILLTAYSLQYEPQAEAHLASAGGVLLSTLMAIGTMPLWIMLCNLLL